MRLLIVAVVSAAVAVVTVIVLRQIDASWTNDSTVRTAIAGAVCGIASGVVSRKLKKDG